MKAQTNEEFDARWAVKFLPEAQADLWWSIKRTAWLFLAGVFYLVSPVLIVGQNPSVGLIFSMVFGFNIVEVLQLCSFPLFLWGMWRLRVVMECLARIAELHKQIQKELEP